MIFVDEAKIFVKAGSGGKGCESFMREKHMRHPRPDGGDGGRGGDVVLQADSHIQTLLDFKYKQHYKAENGGHGGSKGKTGRVGQSCLLRVPVGTLVKEDATGLLIRDLVQSGDQVTVAKGGEGGIGNIHKKFTSPPASGEERKIALELKVVADVGIVGFPNAGKSTLISSISKVRSKVANYPFTTKQPILGFVSGEDFSFIVADLPGIIEGAHKGKGLGDRFLRHAERTKILIHLIDAAGTEMRDPIEDYRIIQNELDAYSEKLLIKEKIIVLNKCDLPGAGDNISRFKKEIQKDILIISALEKRGLEELVEKIREILCRDNSPKT